jgi:glycosyltransferase involved in cell wall biosynthesis
MTLPDPTLSATAPSAPPSITVVILTFNEEVHIARALDSVVGLAQRVVVVDSGSRDATQAIARARGVEIYEHPFLNYADQFQWALDHTDIATDWILRLDADEVIEPDLRARIVAELPCLPSSVAAVNFDLMYVIMGRRIRHGGRYPLILLRLFRRGQGRIEQRWMDEHIIVEGGDTIRMRGGFSHIELKDLTFFTTKHNAYATREAVDAIAKRYGLFPAQGSAQISRQAARTRFIKERIYNHLPLGVGPFLYFLYRYFLRLGFLDGREGAIYHVLQGFWYRYLVDAKVFELEKEMRARGADTPETRRCALSELTGYKL